MSVDAKAWLRIARNNPKGWKLGLPRFLRLVQVLLCSGCLDKVRSRLEVTWMSVIRNNRDENPVYGRFSTASCLDVDSWVWSIEVHLMSVARDAKAWLRITRNSRDENSVDERFLDLAKSILCSCCLDEDSWVWSIEVHLMSVDRDAKSMIWNY